MVRAVSADTGRREDHGAAGARASSRPSGAGIASQSLAQLIFVQALAGAPRSGGPAQGWLVELDDRPAVRLICGEPGAAAAAGQGGLGLHMSRANFALYFRISTGVLPMSAQSARMSVFSGFVQNAVGL